MSGEGHDGIDAMIGGVQSPVPRLRFRRTSEFDAHHDRVRFSWELGPEGGPPWPAASTSECCRRPLADHHRFSRFRAGRERMN